MKALLALVVGSLAMTGALLALEPQPPLPAVRQVWLQQPPLLGPVPVQQERHDKHKADADAYCFNPQTSGSQAGARQRDPHGHECHCHLTCQVGTDGAVTGDSESTDCELYCTRARCSCHVESPCEMPQE
jgi:hypothetical protein